MLVPGLGRDIMDAADRSSFKFRALGPQLSAPPPVLKPGQVQRIPEWTRGPKGGWDRGKRTKPIVCGKSQSTAKQALDGQSRSWVRNPYRRVPYIGRIMPAVEGAWAAGAAVSPVHKVWERYKSPHILHILQITTSASARRMGSRCLQHGEQARSNSSKQQQQAAATSTDALLLMAIARTYRQFPLFSQTGHTATGFAALRVCKTAKASCAVAASRST